MTFNKMRFPIVWITFALCVVLCGVQGGPAGGRKDVVVAFVQDLSGRIARQYGYDESDEEDDETSSNYQGAVGSNGEEDDEDDGEEDDRRRRRDISQKPVLEEEPDEINVPATEETPVPPVKKPSVLELLSSALDKAIEATSKIPTQQVATDAVGVFQILGQVFSEAIDKVIGSDDGEGEADGDGDSDDAEPAPEPIVDKTPDAAEPSSVIPVTEEQMKVEMPLQQEISQSDKEIVNNL